MWFLTLKDEAEKLLSKETERIAENANPWLGTNMSALQTIAQNPLIQSMDPEEYFDHLLAEATRLQYIWITVANTSGDVFQRKDRSVVVSLGHRDYVQEALKGNSFVSDPFFVTAPNTDTTTVCYRFRTHQ